MARTRFVPNRLFEQQIKRDPRYRAGLRLIAETQVKPAVTVAARQAQAPWMPRPGHELIEVEQDGLELAVVNTDYAGHLQEWGSINNPPHAPLRRGVRAAGLRLDEQ